MFLKELWNFNKATALIFLLFILAWSYINYKQGAIAAPLFQYGMYSGKFFINDTQRVARVYANGKLVDITKYSTVKRDMIQLSLEDYITEKKMNDTIFNSMKRILSYVGFGELMKDRNYINHITDKQFTQWYKKLLTKISGYPINTLAVYQQKYIWQNNRLMPIDTPFKLNQVVAY